VPYYYLAVTSVPSQCENGYSLVMLLGKICQFDNGKGYAIFYGMLSELKDGYYYAVHIIIGEINY